MRVLVTGGAGYVGVVLIARLLERGDEVVCLDSLDSSSALPLLPLFSRPGQFRFVRADLRDRERLAACLAGADAVVHLAGVVGYPACNADPEGSWDVNVEGTRRLQSLRSPTQRIVFASTGSVYGEVADDPCTEETPAAPRTGYGRAKLEAEKVLLDGAGAVVLRFATAFGLSPQLRLDLLVNDFCFRAVHERRLTLYEAAFQRTFLHVNDMARALLHALDHYDTMKGEVYNCGDEALGASKLEVAEMIRRSTELAIEVKDGGRDEDRRNYRVSYRKIRATGFAAEVSLERGIEEMLAAFPHLERSEVPARAR